MTSKNNATVVSDVLPQLLREKPSGSKSLSTARPLATQQYLYFTETNTDASSITSTACATWCSRAAHTEGDGELHSEQNSLRCA
jgi:hypothetical protein